MIKLTNRYLFTGRVVLKTALHIGGGRVTLSNSNSPIVLTPEEKPFIPGSSFKGALRSTVEKLVPMLPEDAHLFSCGLPTTPDNKHTCPTARDVRKHTLTDEERQYLCHTCLLFGSPFAAARINVNDLYIAKDKVRTSEDDWSGIIQIRDGVAIDRDSETAVDKRKYDYEVVPATTAFDLAITLENATPEDLQLVCIGLSEFVSGFGAIGGRRSRGLGACIVEDFTVYALELEGDGIDTTERNRRLKNYLLENENPAQKFSQVFAGQESLAFLRTRIEQVFS